MCRIKNINLGLFNRFSIRMNVVFVIIFFKSVFYSFGQDIHYAQFMYSPLNLNPAGTGMFDGDYRFTANHRQQWNSVTVPYKTYSGSFDMNLEKFSNEKNRLNAGIMINSDKAGDSEFGTLEGELSLGLVHYFGNDSQQVISGGIQAGMVQRSINYNKLTFDNQFNGDVYDPAAPTGENFQVSHFYYFNFSAGCAWQYKINKNYIIGAGLSFQHLNKPQQSFFKNKSVRLPIRFQLNINSEISLSDKISVLPDIIWMRQNTFSELTGGGQLKVRVSDKPGKVYSVYLGLEGRLKDAIIPMVGIDFNTLHLGVSYDINTSGLKRASNGRGGWELALVYIIKKVKSTGIKPPCVIY